MPDERRNTLEDILIEVGVTRVLRDDSKNIDKTIEDCVVSFYKGGSCGDDHAHDT